MSCCKPTSNPTTTSIDDTYNLVSSAYASHAAKTTTTTTAATTASHAAVASAFGYSPDALSSLPASANLGVSCGNPLALAHLRPGETLLDLGSGGGLDVLLAARAVAPTGRAIGVDMTPAMIDLATRNAAKAGLTPVAEFRLGRITDVPVADASVDVVISNCVVNLVPNQEKEKVFRECWRVLRDGGRVAISDILTREGTEMPEEIRGDAKAYMACVGGAAGVREYTGWLEDAGFKDIVIVDTEKDLNVYKHTILADEGDGVGQEKGDGAACCGSGMPAAAGSKVDGKSTLDYDLNQWAGAYQIYAIKPVPQRREMAMA